MSTSFSPAQPLLPTPPPGTDRYLLVFYEAIYRELLHMKLRVDTLILHGTAAERPAATGGYQLFWQTDGTPHMEVDNGSWVSI